MNSNAAALIDELGSGSLEVVLEHVFADIGDAVVVADAQRRIITANRTAAQLFGYTQSRLIGRSAADLYADRDEFEHQGHVRFNLGAGERHETYVTRYRRRDGSLFEGETTAGKVYDPDSGRVLYLGIVRDISARRSAEQALHRLHQIVTDRGLDFETRRRRILELGCAHFGVPVGLVSQIEGPRFEIMDVTDASGRLQAGEVFDTGQTYCAHAMRANGPLGFSRASETYIRDHACFRRFGLETYLGSPIRVDGEPYGTLCFSSQRPGRPMTQQDLELVELFAQWLGHEIGRQADVDALNRAHQRLTDAATRDALTGLGNRRLLAECLERERQRCARYGGRFSVALVDFDHFKALNDGYGHAAGDAALRFFAEIANAELREVDVTGRWGGEEFIVLLPNTALAGAVTIADRLRERISKTLLTLDDARVTLTVSIGVAVSDGSEAVETVVSRADNALYAAKRAGRDQVCEQKAA